VTARLRLSPAWPDPAARFGGALPWAALYAAVTAGAGAAAGVVWYAVVDLPGYRVTRDFYARIDEWEEARLFGADVWLAGLGVVTAALLGWLAWVWFRRHGWLAAVLAALGGLGAGVLAEVVGQALGPSDFDARLANAQPGVGTVIPVELASHTPLYLAVWVACAVLPVLAAAALAPANPDWHRLEGEGEDPAAAE
jgi:hypothetical protein